MGQKYQNLAKVLHKQHGIEMTDIEQPRQRHSVVCLDNCVIIFGGTSETFEQIPTRVIWMYNLYTEEWNKHVISDTNAAPEPFHGAVATIINGTIYTFGGVVTNRSRSRNELWTLSKAKRECFTWSFKETRCKEKSPSPRSGHTGWEYAGKLWTFGGWGLSPEGYLHEHGSFSGGFNVKWNNQLLCYDPTTHKWTNLQCIGTVPSPRSDHASTIIRENVWLFGGKDIRQLMDDFFELTMHSLTWTKIQTGQSHPHARCFCTLTVLTDSQLVLHGGWCVKEQKFSDTWIMDLTSHSWRQYTSRRDHTRWGHTGSSGLRSNAIIFGGLKKDNDAYEVYNNVFHVMVEPKCLQELAMQIIYNNQDALPWKFLPVMLISRLGISSKVTGRDNPPEWDTSHS